MINQAAGIRLFDGSLNMLKLPLLNIQVGRNRFVQKICAVTIQGLGQEVQGFHLESIRKVMVCCLI